MNVKPQFTVVERDSQPASPGQLTAGKLHDSTRGGLQLLAGASTPVVAEPATSEFARLFDLLVGHYRYVVVDASSRVDPTTRLVCNISETVLLVAHADVASLWSATRIQQYIGETGGRERVRLVLTAFAK